MVKYYDISNWEDHPYFGTGGTREKEVVENPEDGCLYYFKTSIKKPKMDYTYEFWSEIIASEIGKSLGFNILHYDVSWRHTRLGCLSKSMINSQVEELQEGYKWLTGFDEKYNTEDREAYTFQIIERMLSTNFPNNAFIKEIIKIIIFDSIIGNKDRHQENWSIIVKSEVVARYKLLCRKRTITQRIYSFAPIYDSGSSLGHELTNDKVKQMLKDEKQIEAYINRGTSEIHWEGEKGKQKHMDLISKVAANGYKDTVIEVINSIHNKYNADIIAAIINSIDDCLPPEHSGNKIPQMRKDFWIKLVSLRIKKLFDLQL